MAPSTFAAPPPAPGWGQPYGTPLPSTTGVGQPRPTNPYYQGSPYANAYTNPAPASGPPYARLFQDTGITATHLFGDDGNDMALTEVEASTTAYFANFLNIPNGLRVTPGIHFSLDGWSRSARNLRRPRAAL